jgi:hypothetical protein
MLNAREVQQDVVDALSRGEPILWQGILSYEGRYLVTSVLTPSWLLINSAIVPEDVQHTEISLNYGRQAVKGAEYRPLGVSRYFSFFTWGVFGQHVWLRLNDGQARWLRFREKEEAIEFCDAVNGWIGQSKN